MPALPPSRPERPMVSRSKPARSLPRPTRGGKVRERHAALTRASRASLCRGTRQVHRWLAEPRTDKAGSPRPAPAGLFGTAPDPRSRRTRPARAPDGAEAGMALGPATHCAGRDGFPPLGGHRTGRRGDTCCGAGRPLRRPDPPVRRHRGESAPGPGRGVWSLVGRGARLRCSRS